VMCLGISMILQMSYDLVPPAVMRKMRNQNIAEKQTRSSRQSLISAFVGSKK
jgi:hypothetical protein